MQVALTHFFVDSLSPHLPSSSFEEIFYNIDDNDDDHDHVEGNDDYLDHVEGNDVDKICQRRCLGLSLHSFGQFQMFVTSMTSIGKAVFSLSLHCIFSFQRTFVF